MLCLYRIICLCLASSVYLLFSSASVPCSYLRTKPFLSPHQTLPTAQNGVCGIDKDPPGGWRGPTPALSAHRGGNSVLNWPPPHPVLTPGQHRGALAAPREHRCY